MAARKFFKILFLFRKMNVYTGWFIFDLSALESRLFLNIHGRFKFGKVDKFCDYYNPGKTVHLKQMMFDIFLKKEKSYLFLFSL